MPHEDRYFTTIPFEEFTAHVDRMIKRLERERELKRCNESLRGREEIEFLMNHGMDLRGRLRKPLWACDDWEGFPWSVSVGRGAFSVNGCVAKIGHTEMTGLGCVIKKWQEKAERLGVGREMREFVREFVWLIWSRRRRRGRGSKEMLLSEDEVAVLGKWPEFNAAQLRELRRSCAEEADTNDGLPAGCVSFGSFLQRVEKIRESFAGMPSQVTKSDLMALLPSDLFKGGEDFPLVEGTVVLTWRHHVIGLDCEFSSLFRDHPGIFPDRQWRDDFVRFLKMLEWTKELREGTDGFREDLEIHSRRRYEYAIYQDEFIKSAKRADWDTWDEFCEERIRKFEACALVRPDIRVEIRYFDLSHDFSVWSDMESFPEQHRFTSRPDPIKVVLGFLGDFEEK